VFKRWIDGNKLLYIWDKLLTSEDPASYIRFLLASSIFLTFPHLLIQQSSTDISATYADAVSLIKKEEFLRMTNSLLSRTKKDDMHTQWIFMKYPEEIIDDYEPKFLKLC
jgi:hypothetical protein